MIISILNITDEFLRTSTTRELLARQERVKNLLPLLYRGQDKHMAHSCLKEIKDELGARADQRMAYILRKPVLYNAVTMP